MTDWSLTDEAEFDFLDPQDPTSSPSASDPVPAAGPVPTTTAEDLDTADLSGAVADPTGAVHVWVDADRRVLHVRLSNRWRERLGKDATLDAAVLATIRRAQTRLTAGLDVPVATEASGPGGSSSASLDYLLERSMRLQDQRRKLAAKDPEDVRRRRVVGTRPVGYAAGRQVSVTLDVYGNTHRVTIEPDWLRSVQTADLGEAVVEAHQAAYAEWSPPVVEPGEYEELAHEGELIAAETTALLGRRL